MNKLRTAARAGGAMPVAVLIALAATGCVSPLDRLETATEVERSIHATWLPDAASPGPIAAPDASPATGTVAIDETSTLEACLLHAALHSSTLEAAHRRWRAALERVPQVTAPPDPRVTLGVFLDEVETRVGPQRARLGAQQTLPWFGTLDLRGNAAAHEADAAFARLRAAAFTLFRDVRIAYCELYDLRGATEIARENARLIEQFEEVALARLRVAAGTSNDVLRAQIERGVIDDRVDALEDRRRALVARFNALLERAPGAPAPWPDALAGADALPADEMLRDRLRENNPELVAIGHEIAAGRVATKLAHASARPDVTLSVETILTDDAPNPDVSESGDDALVAGIGLTLPIWRERNDAAVREALQRRLATAAGRARTEHRLLAELEAALSAERAARRRAALHRDTLVPQARESLEASMREYENATVDFTDLLDAERVLLELELTARRAEADAGIARAEIDALTGGTVWNEGGAP